ncbi:hypothetical protein LUZ62_050315 [Rhynchospora pubera]|uniref:RNA helicase n=1 Tax=Rhynchospora pubera TaxID=906938 RepID=A0AAV8G038_9POAL|nr:hypothetical protein LUZ62_050315 [Rhynchospora pubera]
MRSNPPRFQTLARKTRKYPPPPLVLSPPRSASAAADRRDASPSPAMSTRAAPRYAPEDPTLPKPWRGLVDGNTGYLYYWNPETDVTQYERPLPPEDQLPPPPPLSQPARRGISSAAVAAPDRRRRRSYSPDEADDRYAPRARTFHQGESSRGGGMDMYGVNDVRDPRAISVGGRRDYPSGVDGGAAEAYRHHHEIIVIGDNAPPPLSTFESANFLPEILKELHHAGFKHPTPIQAQSWPIALAGNDLVAVAKTGSGKTLGYLLPGFIRIKRLRNDPRIGPTVLVLAPTRELATQIEAEVVKFGRSAQISCTCLYGGAPKGPQLKALERGVDIVVATPGRLWDIMEMRRLSLCQVSYLVLDEADRMLDMGFEPEIRRIIKEVPQRHQTVMFTATWPKDVRAIASDLLVRPVQVNIGRVDELVANNAITQNVEVILPSDKLRRVEQILRSQERRAKVLIFCITKRMCDQLANSLVRQFPVSVIHGDKSQNERERVLSYFRSGRSPILIATDIAARGLDIKDIRTVINYDFPTGIEDYVHRIGRTGRAGATGVAYTFFCQKDARFAKDLIKILEVAKQRVPHELRALALQGGRGKMSSRPVRGWRPIDTITDRAFAGERSRERNGDFLSGRGRAPEPSFGRYDSDRVSRGGYDAHAHYDRYNGGDVGDARGRKVGDKAPRERDSSYNRYRSPSPKRARSDNPSHNIRSPQRARSDYPPRDKHSSSPKRDLSDYPSRDNGNLSPKRVRSDCRSHDNYSCSPKRDRSDYPSRNPSKSRASYQDANSRSPSPNPRRSHEHSPSKSRSPSRSLSPKITYHHSAGDHNPNPKKWRASVRSHSRSPSLERSLSRTPSPRNSPYRHRSHGTSHDQDQDFDQPIDQAASPQVSDHKLTPGSPPTNYGNDNRRKQGSPFEDNGTIKDKLDDMYTGQSRDGSPSTVGESNGYFGANSSHPPLQNGGNDGMEGEEGGVDTMADVY